jgi:DNA-binding winged helix-turn-helix (wHTH) protein/predicted ATPase
MEHPQPLTFDRYRLDLPNEQLWQGNQVIPLPSKALAVLRYLVEHAGQVVTKAELFAALWPGIAVSDGALTFCIVELRKALGDNAKAPRFIETVHRRGYRFIGNVVSGQSSVISSPPTPPPQAQLATDNWQLATPLVGRETELAQLHSWLDKALQGGRQMVFVTGEPGIGKTTLVENFVFGVQERLEESQKSKIKNQNAKVSEAQSSALNPQSWSWPNPQPHIPDLVPWIAHGQCIEHYGPGEPYMPILEALGRLCRQPAGDRLIELLHRHAPTWLVQLPALLTAPDLEALQRKTQGATRERMLRELGEAVEVLTAERPLVLVLEDLHWSDASTLELLALLARRREPARLLVIGTYRPADVTAQEHPLRAVKQELQLHGLCTELPLGLLSETQVAEYLEQRVGVRVHGHAPLQTLAKMIHRRTDGNPLFMVTTIDDLIGQQILSHREGQWILPDDPTAIEPRVPDTLQELMERQIERLSAEERRVLEVASVVGMEFSAATVAAGLATEVEAVEEWCEGLAHQGRFVRASGTAEWPDGTVATRYSFLHALYQEVLYMRLPAGRRRRLHQRIGEREEQAYGERVREIATELAVHFKQGHDYHKAVQYLHHAGENAVRRSANVEAITHLTTALELLNTLPDTRARAQQEITLQVALGVPLQATRGFASPEVKAVYTRARELCHQVGETRQLFPVLFGLRRFYDVRGEPIVARELAEQLLGLAQREHDPALLAEAHWALGSTFFNLGEFGAARTHLEQSLTLYEAQRHHSPEFFYGGTERRVVGLSFVALVLWHLGYPDQARQKSAAAQTLAQEVSHPFSVAGVRALTAMTHQLRRERALTQEWAETALALAREHGFPLWIAQGTVLRGWALAEQGQGKEGNAQIRQGLAAYRATGAEWVRSFFLLLLAEAYKNAGQIEEGLSALTDALTVIDKTGERFYEAEVYRLKGTLTLQSRASLGQVKTGQDKSEDTGPRSLIPDPQTEAEACFHKAIEIARKQQAKSLELRASTSLARLWQIQGKREEAHNLLAVVYGWFTEGFDTKDWQEAKALLEELAH